MRQEKIDKISEMLQVVRSVKSFAGRAYMIENFKSSKKCSFDFQ